MCSGSRHTPVSSGWKEVDATVNAAVRYSSLPVDIQFLLQVFFILFIDILYNGLPAVEQKTKKRANTCLQANIAVRQSQKNILKA